MTRHATVSQVLNKVIAIGASFGKRSRATANHIHALCPGSQWGPRPHIWSGWMAPQDAKDAPNYRTGAVMKTIYRATVLACGAAVSVTLLAPLASACGGPDWSGKPLIIQQLKQDPFDAMEGASADSALRDADSAAHGRGASIVGMWKIKELAFGNRDHTPPIPDGTQIDFGYAQWHGDGTEFYNSGGFAPATQNYCLGVWVETSHNKYQVNHFALTYDMGGHYTGIINIRETVSVSPGGTKYSGTFTINAYDLTGSEVNHLTGQVTGERVTLDTAP